METSQAGAPGDAVVSPAVLAAAGVVAFDVDLQSGEIRAGPRLNALLGYPEDRPLTRDEFLARVHPDDAPAVRAVARGESGRFEHAYRVVLPDGTVRWLHARGEVSVEQGVPRRLRGVCFEITERKRSEAAARESEERYRALAASSPAAILVSCGGACVYANDAAARLLHAGSPRELLGRSPLELMAADYRELALLRFAQVLERREALPRVRYRWQRLDSGEVDVDLAAAWVQWQGEDAVQIVAHDITEEILIEEALRESRALLADELEDATRLQSVSARLIEADDANAIYRQLLQEAVRLMRADLGTVQRFDPVAARLRLVVAEGFAADARQPGDAMAEDVAAPSAQALHERRRIVVEDLTAPDVAPGSRGLDDCRRHGVRAFQSTPLLARDGTVVGVMSTHWKAPHRPAERELRLLDLLARQAADLLERHHAQERLAAVERRQSFLLALSDTLREVRDPEEGLWRACRLLGEHLGVDRVHFGEHDAAAARVVIVSDWFRPGLQARSGTYPVRSFRGTPMGIGEDNGTRVVPDAATAAQLPGSARVTCNALGIGAFVTAPLVRGGVVAWMLSVVCGRAREWTPDEVRLVEEAADRTAGAVERTRAERALQESRRTLQAFYDSSPLMMGTAEVRGESIVATRMNEAAARFFGEPAADAPAAGRAGMPADAGAVWLAHYRRAQYRARPVRFEYEHVRGEDRRWVSAIVVCLGTEPTGYARFSFVAEDVTERKRVEALAREGEERRLLLLSLDDALHSMAGAADVQREACRVVLRMLGVDRVLYAEAGGPDRFVVTASDTARIGDAGPAELRLSEYAAGQADELRAGRVASGPRTVVTGGVPPAGSGSVDAIDAPLVRGGALVALMSAHGRGSRRLDADPALLEEAAERTWAATQRANAHAALRDSEEKYRRLFESIDEGFSVYELVRDDAGRAVDARWTQVNPAAERQTGIRAEDFVGRLASEVLPGLDRGWIERFERVAHTGQSERFEHCIEPGRRWYDVTAFLYGPDRIAVLYDEISARKRIEAALRESEERFRSLIENVRDYAIFMLDPDGRVAEWTIGAERVLGYPAAEVLGRPAAMFYTPADVAAGVPQADLEEAERVGRVEREAWRVCAGGRRIWANEIATEVRGPDGALRGFLKISRNLTERRRTEQALSDAARHKDEFLAMLSHELRNPLAPIRNSVYVLRHVRGESEAAGHAQSVIERQTQHLARLVDDLLDVTRIARGKIELKRERIELRELVRRASEDFRTVMEDRRIGFTVEVPEDEVWCIGDATRLNQAIGNLLANAAKFTVDGDRVGLALHVVGRMAQVRVSDSGTGIDPDLLPHLFDPFVQGTRTRARSEGGLGLGLALVKGIVELHGGRVTATSDGRDRGAEFVLVLPLGPAAPARPAAAPAVESDRPRLHVLVVDDNVDAAESLAAMLQLQGHIVEIAYDGPAALARAREAPPHVVLCDIGLPRMSGYEVARALRATPGFNGRLVAVSGYAQPDDVRRCLDAGFDAHLAKPFDPERLERLLG